MEVNLFTKLRQWAWGASLLSATTLPWSNVLVSSASASNSSIVFVTDDDQSAVVSDEQEPAGPVAVVGDLPPQAATPSKTTAPKLQPAPQNKVALFSSPSSPATPNQTNYESQPSRPSMFSSRLVQPDSRKTTLFSKPSAERSHPANDADSSSSPFAEPLTIDPPEPEAGTTVRTRSTPHAEKSSLGNAPTEIDEAGKYLILANQHALRATTVEDYTAVIKLCAAAVRSGSCEENREFAASTISWALNRRGQLHTEAGHPDQADADFHAALDFNPKNWRALHNRAVSYAEARQFAEAFDDFNRVIEANPQFAKCYTNRATLFMQAGDMESAKLDYEKACELDDSLVSARTGLGRVCHLLGEWEDAIEHFTLAMRVDPENPDVVCSRGDLFADMGRYREALMDYARTIEIDPEFAHAYRNGAWLLATCPDERFRDPENAVLGAQQALEFDYGDRHVALDTLAAALAAAGDYERAVEAMQEALAEAPATSQQEYEARIHLYRQRQPYLLEPVGEVAHATYEVSDR